MVLPSPNSPRVNPIEERCYDPNLEARRSTEIPSNLQMLIDYNPNGTTKTVGYNARGMATSEVTWLLQRLNYSIASLASFTNISGLVSSRKIAYDSWDNRDTASYS